MVTRSKSAEGQRRIPWWGWVLIILGVATVLVKLPPLGIIASIAALGFAVLSLTKKTPAKLKLASSKQAVLVSSLAVLGLLVSSSALAKPVTTSATQAPAALVNTEQHPATSRPAPKTKTPKPIPTPQTVLTQLTEVQPVPFGQQRIDDAAYAQGTEQVTTTGVYGERTITYEVTTVDGVETGRRILTDEVTLAPIDEVVSVGTYVAPVAPVPLAQAPASAGGDCNPNYADACVPNDPVDVDCAGGGGNGPSYFDGVARVVGTDVYDLDRDKDGYACN